MRNDVIAVVRCLAVCALVVLNKPAAGDVAVRLESPMTPPAWALMERELLRANTIACEEFFSRYFDERGYLECVVRWGGIDGPDDAIESVAEWPLLHALGAPDGLLHMYKKAWEGHLRQYTEAKTVQVKYARDGMYYKEFPVMLDWTHLGEGLRAFYSQGLSDPDDLKFQQRVKRFAGFYMNEDPGAPNYDPQHKIIRSMFNGSRGPLLRKATALDWAGDPIQISGRFKSRHGERTWAEIIAHVEDYTDTVGDHPQNLAATSLPTSAFLLTQEAKYRDWVLEYVDAWRERTLSNGGMIPTNIGLDGTIGGATDGKWYGGVYGWGFTVVVPQTQELAHRKTAYLGLVGFGNALLLTGDQRYVDVWRQQIDTINAQAKVIDGTVMYPHMYGDDGWYDYTPNKYTRGAMEVYYWSMRQEDLERVSNDGWVRYLEGKNPGYPEQALGNDFATIRRQIRGMRADTTTPDTRLSDHPMEFNPATVGALVRLTLGGLYPWYRGALHHYRVRYFDPVARRAGLPADVAALVETMSADETTLTLVNVNQVEPRTVIVQMGAYAEHQCSRVTVSGRDIAVEQPFFTVRLAPGAGGRMVIHQERYANEPTLAHPWD